MDCDPRRSVAYTRTRIENRGVLTGSRLCDNLENSMQRPDRDLDSEGQRHRQSVMRSTTPLIRDA